MRIVSGNLKNRSLKSPKGSTTRPTSELMRAAIFNICQGSIDGMQVLDVCAGTGAIGLEALSRGAAHATFIEKHRNAAQCIQENIQQFKLNDQARLLCGDALLLLKKLKLQYDFIYIDPPYTAKSEGNLLALQLLQVVDKQELLKKNGWLFVETPVKESLPLDKLSHLQLESTRTYGSSNLHILRIQAKS
jgi:16S rRNA (guanine(966)-N(2))-methyltransferase RsmD